MATFLVLSFSTVLCSQMSHTTAAISQYSERLAETFRKLSSIIGGKVLQNEKFVRRLIQQFGKFGSVIDATSHGYQQSVRSTQKIQ